MDYRKPSPPRSASLLLACLLLYFGVWAAVPQSARAANSKSRPVDQHSASAAASLPSSSSEHQPPPPGSASSSACCQPEQVHLSLVRQPPTERGPAALDLMVQWVTGCQCPHSRVRYGFDAASSSISQVSSAHTWRHAKGNERGKQWLHRARISMRTAAHKTCFYVVCSEQTCSKTFWTNAPGHLAPGSGLDNPHKHLIFGDLGLGSGKATIARLEQLAQSGDYVAMFHVGDIAYDLHTHGGRVGDEFLRRMEGAAAYLPYMTAPGNHEAYHDFQPYINRFTMPVPDPFELDSNLLPADMAGNMPSEWPRPVTNISEDYEPFFYSIDIGLVHFISYDTESYYARPQLRNLTRQWLHDDLREANRRRRAVPWIVAFAHRPMYCSNVVDNECRHANPSIRREFERIFHEGGVDLIVEGHEHSYERFYPVFNNSMTQADYRNPRAPVHIISGQTGCSENFLGLCTNPILFSRYPFSAYRSWYPGLNGYGRLTVLNATHLLWEQVLDHFFQVTLDEVLLVQEHHGSFIQ